MLSNIEFETINNFAKHFDYKISTYTEIDATNTNFWGDVTIVKGLTYIGIELSQGVWYWFKSSDTIQDCEPKTWFFVCRYNNKTGKRIESYKQMRKIEEKIEYYINCKNNGRI